MTHDRPGRLQVARRHGRDILHLDELLKALGPAFRAFRHRAAGRRPFGQADGRGRQISGDGQLADLLGRTEGSRRRDAEPLLRGIDAAGVDHHVLLSEGERRIGRRETELGKLLLRDVDVDHPVSDAPELHTRDVLHDAQLLLQELREIFLLGVGEAAARHRQEEAVDEAPVVGDLGLPRARRQKGTGVVDLTAHLVPDLRQAVGEILGLDIHPDDRETGPGNRIELVELGQLLQGDLEPVRNLQLDLLRTGAGIGRNDGRGLDREGRVLEPPEREEAADAAADKEYGQEIGDRALLNRDFRE